MELSTIDYAAVFLVTVSMALFLTPLALRFALRRSIVDAPSPIKAQESPVPYLGGTAIVVSFALAVLVAALVNPPNEGLRELAIILGVAVVLAIVGLVDDLRSLGPGIRLVVEVAAGVTVWASDAGAELFANDVLDLVVTVLWIVGVTNGLNFLDNMDGLSAGVSAIAAFSFFAIAVDNGQFLVATLAIALAGCAIGFLRSNFHPARIYMGDAGALFLGFMLAVIGLKLRFEGPQVVTFAVPILVLGVVLFDTALITTNRLLHRRSPLKGGRDHTSHRLVFVGASVPTAVVVLYLAGASLGWLGLVMARLDQAPGLMLLGWITALLVGLGVVLSRIPVYETSRRRHLMIQEVVKHEEPLEAERRTESA